MISDDVGVQLHHRAVFGKPLSAEERAQLQSWYDEQDRIEMKTLGLDKPSAELAELQAQVQWLEALAEQLTRENEEIEARNRELHAEIAVLRQKHAQRVSPQPV